MRDNIMVRPAQTGVSGFRLALCASTALCLGVLGNMQNADALFMGQGAGAVLGEPILLSTEQMPGYSRSQFSDGRQLFVDRADPDQRVMVLCQDGCQIIDGVRSVSGEMPSASEKAALALVRGSEAMVEPEAPMVAEVVPERAAPQLVEPVPVGLPPLELVLQLGPKQDLTDIQFRARPNT